MRCTKILRPLKRRQTRSTTEMSYQLAPGVRHGKGGGVTIVWRHNCKIETMAPQKF